ncbi:hypothetical protein BRDCF_p1689 [Bacteroidales bacterium CF]|nr:hypothetical protein BRDCF_p1689 [Bacteroidales bacterium CF]
MSSLVKNKIPAIGFINERKIRNEADGGRYQKELPASIPSCWGDKIQG